MGGGNRAYEARQPTERKRSSARRPQASSKARPRRSGVSGGIRAHPDSQGQVGRITGAGRGRDEGVAGGRRLQDQPIEVAVGAGKRRRRGEQDADRLDRRRTASCTPGSGTSLQAERGYKGKVPLEVSRWRVVPEGAGAQSAAQPRRQRRGGRRARRRGGGRPRGGRR